jgi:ribosome-associated protein
MIQVTSTISLAENTIDFDFVRASGPGGQNVNKVASAVQLRFHINKADLPGDVEERLRRLAKKRITDEGALIIEARRYREQERNRQDALNRLVELIRRAAEKPKPRRKTRPTQAATERRLKSKRQRSQIKHLRSPVDRFDS